MPGKGERRGEEGGRRGEGVEGKKSKNTPSVNSCLRPWYTVPEKHKTTQKLAIAKANKTTKPWFGRIRRHLVMKRRRAGLYPEGTESQDPSSWPMRYDRREPLALLLRMAAVLVVWFSVLERAHAVYTG